MIKLPETVKVPLCWGLVGADRLLARYGVRKHGTPRCRRRRKACSTSLASEAGSIRQNEPLPGSSWLRATLTKYLQKLIYINMAQFIYFQQKINI